MWQPERSRRTQRRRARRLSQPARSRAPRLFGLFALATLAGIVALGCAATPARPRPTRFGALLSTAPKSALRERVRPPTGECLEHALRYVKSEREIVRAPLAPNVRERIGAIVDGLHPVAAQVMRRTEGLWFAENIPGASAMFLPCGVDPKKRTGGFLLVDLGQFPLDEPMRDAEVPALYWRSLGGKAAAARSYSISDLDGDKVTRTDHAVRYLVLHELGHALSLHAGEFELDKRARIRVGSLAGFAGFSWRKMTTWRRYLPLVPGGPTVQAIVPRHTLGTIDWGSVLEAQGADAELLAPGYALLSPQGEEARARDLCELVPRIPKAGFVTPTAARYPTEDFAEMFAHAIMAAEGKIRPTDRIELQLPECPPIVLESPYFRPELAPKRAYIEAELGFLRPPR